MPPVGKFGNNSSPFVVAGLASAETLRLFDPNRLYVTELRDYIRNLFERTILGLVACCVFFRKFDLEDDLAASDGCAEAVILFNPVSARLTDWFGRD